MKTAARSWRLMVWSMLWLLGAVNSDLPAYGQIPDTPVQTRSSDPSQQGSPADRIQERLPLPLNEIVAEVLARNPDVARKRARAVATVLRAPQVSALPDPMAALTLFLASPETRVGPQQVSATVSQRLPWFGKLPLREKEALYRAAMERADTEATRLSLVVETVRLYYELAFAAAEREVVEADRATLIHYEVVARSRYAAGVGLEQAVVKLQAEITKDDDRLLQISRRQVSLRAALNSLRDRPPESPIPVVSLPPLGSELSLSYGDLAPLARRERPEMARARAWVAATAVASESAEKDFKPDFTLGLGYTVVGRRDDPAGRANPPGGNGDDIVGLSVGVNLPVWKEKLRAGVEEAAAREAEAAEELRSVALAIDRELDDLSQGIPLTRRRFSLFEGLLIVQASEALRSAETGYAAGTLGALDLLDAERVLLDVQTAAVRAKTDYLIALARLEGALGAPLADLNSEAGHD